MTSPFASAAARLIDAAGAIAAAQVEQLRLARHDPAAAWREANLLWPNFGKTFTKG